MNERIMNKKVVKCLEVTVNCMRKIANLNWFKFVEDTEKLENEFQILIKHGVGFDLIKIAGAHRMGHGDINLLRHFLSTGTFSASCQPWRCLIVGFSRNLIEFLKRLILCMNSWIGDDQDFAESGYPAPLMISNVVKWSPELGELWMFNRLSSDTRRFSQFNPHYFTTWTPTNRAENSVLVMSRKFGKPGFSVDDVINSAAAILLRSVCFHHHRYC